MTYRIKEEREKLAVFGYGILFNWLIEDTRIDCLKKVFLKSVLTPQDVVLEAKKKLIITGGMNQAIYEHIQYALYREMKDNPDSRVIDEIYVVAKQYYSECYGDEYARLVQSLKGGRNIDFYIDSKKAPFIYFFLVYENIALPKQFVQLIDSSLRWYTSNRLKADYTHRVLSLTEQNFSDGQCVETSKAYNEVYSKTISNLINYLKLRYTTDDVNEANWSDYVGKCIHIGLHKDNAGEIYLDTLDCIDTSIFEGISILAHQDYSFSIDLLSAVMGDVAIGKEQLVNYHPNVEQLFPVVVQALIKNYYEHNDNEKMDRRSFRTKLSVFLTDNIETLYNNLVHLYYIDCIFKVLEKNRDEYYYNFAWFYDIEKEDAPVIENTEVVALTEVIFKKDASYERLNAQYERERKRVNEVCKKHAHELAEKDRAIAEQTSEIEKLQKQIQIQQEYLNLVNAAEEPDVTETLDISSLYGKRFLFVGKLHESNAKLKQTFPTSTFMETDTANIKSLKVDGVVFLIRNMGHSMYYKVMQSNQFAELPKIYCNSRNINNIFQAMLRGTK